MIRTQFNYKKREGKGEFPPSTVIPNQTLEISVMLLKHQQGVLPLQITNAEYLEGDEPLPKIADLTDLDDLQGEIDQIHTNVAERKKKAAEQLILPLQDEPK